MCDGAGTKRKLEGDCEVRVLLVSGVKCVMCSAWQQDRPPWHQRWQRSCQHVQRRHQDLRLRNVKASCRHEPVCWNLRWYESVIVVFYLWHAGWIMASFQCAVPCLQCFDAVGWAAGMASGLQKLSGDVLAWLSVWSEMQMVYIWSSWCHCHPIISCSSKLQNGLHFWCRLTRVVLEKRLLNGCNSSDGFNVQYLYVFSWVVVLEGLLQLSSIIFFWGPDMTL